MNDNQVKSLLTEFKARMSIYHSSEDAELENMLQASYDAVKRMTGVSDITNNQFKELIIERTRYVYNDQAEFFEDNFLSTIIGLNLQAYGEGDDDNG
ncbi:MULTISPECIES: phage gp6-like head-tail connector protein [Lacticaseibacillus]|uniref:Phage gp6-like head-tail connector protein n=1 Tax=Lacticaseibacillus casei DSM 20011 = JCM 1134 = ATCC 393 TaxID=1423732 RepID=A0AAD1APG9_LACCA|nr:phage gp6-like head-tail connector protein [Lacticaseibacillus casei]MBI6598863.1 phage gp6-like head-tail connector protein [Lacticaseibacillus casei]MBO1482533.1 phage gp6-like head-tail connector protein [Lacticaseibacillus casei]MBO2417814.1 phage gp6-like head-tail connector protein [Lacticaseibacillus casei]MCK2082197.1 phage gp6-like head-tail connector protein [Lacticaseibacillus casei]MED7631937.1 phage gp6-like head-tail connector protein [Lacticaseibacillus casei]